MEPLVSLNVSELIFNTEVCKCSEGGISEKSQIPFGSGGSSQAHCSACYGQLWGWNWIKSILVMHRKIRSAKIWLRV